MNDYFVEDALALHQSEEQLVRQENLSDVAVVSIDKEDLSGVIGNHKYLTTLSNCTCRDFKARKLPCKHMYRLALDLGRYKTARNKRTTDLIANFSSGYAFDWKFALPTCFRNSLDIKLMPRSTGIKGPDGNMIFENEWTQGNFYSFSEGAIFYSDEIAYEDCWANALKELKYSIKITKVLPSVESSTIEFIDGQIVNKSSIKYGILIFNLYKPLKDEVGIELINTYQCFQDKFVDFLRTGRLELSSSKEINFFE